MNRYSTTEDSLPPWTRGLSLFFFPLVTGGILLLIFACCELSFLLPPGFGAPAWIRESARAIYGHCFQIARVCAFHDLASHLNARLVSCDPVSTVDLLAGAYHLVDGREFGAAIVLLEAAQKLEPFNFEIMRLLGVCHHELRDGPRALYWLKRALEENPQDFESLKHYFFVCYHQKLNWEGVSLGDHLLRQEKLFDREEIRLVSYLLESMKRKCQESF